ncbi:MAG: SusD/RagB family nutrient-binding outer membrane lipoprotein [Gemmatimonadota bacterium]|nr:SusD/RagB family nutrient-binding outer membrane lipoprotein [Gemmatimonadota bacterium]
MKRRYALVLAGSLTLSVGCQDFLAVNTNPNAPEVVAPNLYLAPMLHWMVTSPQFDGRFVARYTQELTIPLVAGTGTPTTWDRMGYDRTSDNGGQQWRDYYWSFGQNLIDMMTKAEAEQRWDLLGIGYILKAWGWLALTDLHGEIIIKEAFDPTKLTFSYDSQQFAYEEVFRLLDSASVYLQKSGGVVEPAYVARGDKIYNGDRAKWLKFANGLRARALNHFSNKSTYNPAAVIAAVDASFASNADDAMLTYPGADPGFADFNFLGRTRNNFTTYRQTQFVVGLMNGTQFGAVDPRMTRMLVPDSLKTTWRGLNPNDGGFAGLPVTQQPRNPMGYVGTGGVGLSGWYLFDDKAKMPAMTYAQLQFVKAEAAYRMGDQATALTAYTNGVSAHIDWVNARNLDNNQSGRPDIAPTQITAAEKAAFLADPRIVPAVGTLTLTHIMSQKYIAQWAWGHNEVWMDMRRYHYTDIDPASGRQVYPGFAIPTNLDVDNAGKPAQRIRPRYNSEYVWNRAALDAIGGLALDYQTVPLWITQP